MYWITLHGTGLHWVTLHCTASHCITLHYIALHCITLHYIALRCMTFHSYIHIHIDTCNCRHRHAYIHTHTDMHTCRHQYWTVHQFRTCGQSHFQQKYHQCTTIWQIWHAYAEHTSTHRSLSWLMTRLRLTTVLVTIQYYLDLARLTAYGLPLLFSIMCLTVLASYCHYDFIHKSQGTFVFFKLSIEQT